ncbi:hypothetical protein EOD08_35330 [Mesorhizobium sp. M6A.T.Ca.TU.002.02.2.1]|nr:hypothetical protein EOD08_35330 [Mesorhizobium sp. M6A.T.Ca.TU.002.02.2.1]
MSLLTRLASAVREFIEARYRPELHYMRGAGLPACAVRSWLNRMCWEDAKRSTPWRILSDGSVRINKRGLARRVQTRERSYVDEQTGRLTRRSVREHG